MGRYRQRQAFFFGIDYFKAYIKRDEYKKSLLFSMSANSNFVFYDKETMIELKPEYSDKKYSKYFEIRDRQTNVSLAFILLGKVNNIGAILRRDKVEVTGQGLMLRSIGYYKKMLEVMGYYIDGFVRVDIALDIPICTDYLLREILYPNVKDKTVDPVVRKGKWQTLYIGSRDPSNTWKLIRAYNKVLDTNKKGKDFLYNFKEKGIKDMSRIELVLYRDKCRHFHESYLTDIDKLYDIFKHEVFGINFQFFKFIHKEDVRQCINTYLIDIFEHDKGLNVTKGLKSKKKIMVEKLDKIIKYGSQFKNETDRQKTVSMFVAYLKKLLGNGHTYVDIMDIIELNMYDYKPSDVEKMILEIKRRSKESIIIN